MLRERAPCSTSAGTGSSRSPAPAAVDFAQRVLARDVEYLTSDRCMMSLVLDESGQSWTRSSPSAGRRGCSWRAPAAPAPACWTICWRTRGGRRDRRPLRRPDVIGLEGPYAWGVVGRLIDGELASLPFESVVDTTWNGVDIVFARTGYTGEYGYQMIVPRQAAPGLWAGALEHAQACGARRRWSWRCWRVRQPIPRHEATPGASVIEIAPTGWSTSQGRLRRPRRRAGGFRDRRRATHGRLHRLRGRPCAWHPRARRRPGRGRGRLRRAERRPRRHPRPGRAWTPNWRRQVSA
ncbi:hypothetical protein [Nonomuraea dietziae]|uniref:hypothetical protein n=1 Tax=Nonomuraea dietziae TaxID=65515 RepID=UPI0031D4F10F